MSKTTRPAAPIDEIRAIGLDLLHRQGGELELRAGNETGWPGAIRRAIREETGLDVSPSMMSQWSRGVRTLPAPLLILLRLMTKREPGYADDPVVEAVIRWHDERKRNTGD